MVPFLSRVQYGMVCIIITITCNTLFEQLGTHTLISD